MKNMITEERREYILMAMDAEVESIMTCQISQRMVIRKHSNKEKSDNICRIKGYITIAE